MRGGIFLSICLFFLSFLVLPVYAHPGRTASDGCHYCRTNCAKWGEVQDARHCHGGGSSSSTTTTTNTAPQTTQPQPIIQPQVEEITEPITEPIIVAEPSPETSPSPSTAPTQTSSPSPSLSPDESPNPEVLGETDEVEEIAEEDVLEDEGSVLGGLIGLGILGGAGYGGYKLWRGRKSNLKN